MLFGISGFLQKTSASESGNRHRPLSDRHRSHRDQCRYCRNGHPGRYSNQSFECLEYLRVRNLLVERHHVHCSGGSSRYDARISQLVPLSIISTRLVAVRSGFKSCSASGRKISFWQLVAGAALAATGGISGGNIDRHQVIYAGGNPAFPARSRRESSRQANPMQCSQPAAIANTGCRAMYRFHHPPHFLILRSIFAIRGDPPSQPFPAYSSD